MFYILSSLFHFGHLMNTCTNLSWEWQWQIQMVRLKNYNFNVNEDFVMFLISKLITCFITGSTSGMKSQSIACLSTNWMYTYILDFRPWRWSAFNMGFVVKQPSRMQGQYFFRSWAGQATCFGQVQIFLWRATQSGSNTSKVCKGVFNVCLS